MINMFGDLSNIKTHADVAAEFVEPLIKDLGYPSDRIQRDQSVSELTVANGSQLSQHRPDVVLQSADDEPAIIIEVKNPGESHLAGVAQALGYAHELNKAYPGRNPVEYCMITNAKHLGLWRWDNNDPILELEFGEFTSGDERYVQLKSIVSYGAVRTNSAAGLFAFKRPTVAELQKTLKACHDIIWKRESLDPATAFSEFAKLLFVKLREDERLSMEATRRDALDRSDFRFSVDDIRRETASRSTNNPVADIMFEEVRKELADSVAKGKSKPIFGPEEKLDLSAATILEVVRRLQHWNLHGIDEDLNGRSFETFLSATVRGKDLGQFFTPRSVVKFMSKAAGLEIRGGGDLPKVLDGCCGSAGFLIEAMALLVAAIEDQNVPKREKEKLTGDLKSIRLYGIEKSHSVTKIARLNMHLHGDGASTIFNGDALDKDVNPSPGAAHQKTAEAQELHKLLIDERLRFDVVLTNPPFSMKYRRSNPDEKAILDRYAIGRASDGKMPATLNTNVMFIERYHDLLEPGGELLTVIDNSVLNGVQSQPYRDFILKHFVVLAVVSLPYNAFRLAETSVKTSVLHLRKRRDGDVQGSVFMATLNNIGHDDSKRPTPERDNTSELSRAFSQWRDNGLVPDISQPQTVESETMECRNQVWVTPAQNLKSHRLDAYYYAPELHDTWASIQTKQIIGSATASLGRALELVKPMSGKEVNSRSSEVFKYIQIGDITKSGQIDGFTENTLDDLPTRARILLQTDDILLPKQVGSRGRATLIPGEFDGALASTGFIVIRPSDHAEALALLAVLMSDTISTQAYYLGVGSILTELREETFREEVVIPMPPPGPGREALVTQVSNLLRLRREVAKSTADVQRFTEEWLNGSEFD